MFLMILLTHPLLLFHLPAQIFHLLLGLSSELFGRLILMVVMNLPGVCAAHLSRLPLAVQDLSLKPSWAEMYCEKHGL